MATIEKADDKVTNELVNGTRLASSPSDLRSPLRRVSLGKASASTGDNDGEVKPEKKPSTGKDLYCWMCHKEKCNVTCTKCPRAYHYKCLPSNGASETEKTDINNADAWVCVECKAISRSETERVTSPMLSGVSEEVFSTLLKYALQTIKQTAEPTFHQPVTEAAFPDYKDFVVQPMDFLTIDRNIRRKHYKSTESLLSDVKWIVHNCYVYNDHSHPLTQNAKYFLKVAKNEMAEIEVCPDCFMNFYVYPKSWLVEVCSRPHALVWARLKGHPFWPAKAVRVDKQKKEVDCRFFGAHDRAWVPFDSCFKMSEAYAWTKPKGHKSKLDSAVKELKEHIEKVNERFSGAFSYAPIKTLFDPDNAFLVDDSPEMKKILPASATQSHKDSVDSLEDEKPLVIATPETVAEPTPATSRSPTKSASILNKAQKQPVSNKRKSPAAATNKSVKKPASDESNKSKPSANLDNSKIKDDEIPQPVSPPKKPKLSPAKSVTPNVESKLKEQPAKTTNARKINATTEARKVTPPSVSKAPAKTPTTNSNGKSSPPTSSTKLSASTTAIKTAAVPAAATATTAAKTTDLDYVKSLKDEIASLKKDLASEKVARITEVTKIREAATKELRAAKEKAKDEKGKAVSTLEAELREKYEKEIAEIKRKQWCAACFKEAIYFCCWNTSYCGYQCQSKHWPLHMSVCQQQSKTQGAPSSVTEDAGAAAGDGGSTTTSSSTLAKQSAPKSKTPA